ncbi:MAG: hypothetical protein BGO26_14075 [Actinobacteria bacterium 69-20]|jgi:dipeptidyl aminopeptidase/acylaminoacyl peptidase|nr:S9 family peptidase [Actinomycetota bacterium]OJV29461.1 MAG: hypothetical protein BGO26_14075 [Actinobacteria bacterium 69-20]
MSDVPGALTPSDLRRQSTPGQLAVRGDTVVYTLRHAVDSTVDGSERIELWTVPFAGGEARALTHGPGRDSCPRIDPAGTRVAFLRSIGDAPAQIWLVDLPGSDARAVADFPRGVQDVAWSPDGASLIALAEDADSPRIIRSPGLPGDRSPTAIRLTTIDWRADGEPDGGLRLHPRHLHRVPVTGGVPVRLTSGAWSASRPRVDSSGRVYFLADLRADSDLDPTPQVHRIDPDGTGMRAMTALAGGVVRYHVTGQRLRVLGHTTAGRPDAEPARWLDVPIAATRNSVDTAEYDDILEPDSLWTGVLGDETDLHEWNLELDDCAELTTVSRDGSTVPVDAATGEVLAEGAGRGVICGALATDGGRRVAVLAMGRSAGSGAAPAGESSAGAVAGPAGWAPDLYALDGVAPRRLTSHGAWLNGHRQPDWQRREFPGPAGPIAAFIVEPPGGMRCRATILDLHGGPTGQWGVVPPVEAILLAGAGYRVVLPNIRGSIDRGPDWVAALGGAWGRADVADVLAVLDGLVEGSLADEDRIGVMGLSYGGFLVQYLLGVTNRFAAAVAENGVSNQVFAWAASDLGPSYNRSANLGDPLTADGARALWDASPLKNVAQIRTPLLLLQGGDDRTCPAADNEQLFVALRALHRDVEYVIYPEESHLMQATGRPDRRIDRHERVIAWFDTHLAVAGAR